MQWVLLRLSFNEGIIKDDSIYPVLTGCNDHHLFQVSVYWKTMETQK
jgi:hypothetical protein